MKYRHYGIAQKDFNKSLLKKAVTNPTAYLPLNMRGLLSFYLNKPLPGTGFWASRVDSNFGWKEFCEYESFNLDSLTTHTDFELTSDARIYEIDSSEKVSYLRDNYSLKNGCGFNFENLAEDYDVLELVDMTCDLRNAIYGWDCESILILNPEVIL